MTGEKRVAPAILAMVLLACGGGVDRASAMTRVADDAAETFEALPGVADEATAAIESACASGEVADFEAASEAVAAAQERWHATEALWMGPVTDRRSNALIDWPAGVDDIDELLAATEPETIDAGYLAEFVGADTRGYGAARQLLADAPIEGRACDYTVAAAELAATEINEIVQAWTGAEDRPFREELADPETGIDLAVNQLIVVLAGSEPDQLPARATSVELVLFGDDGGSGLTAMVDDDLTARLRTETDTMIAAAQADEPDADTVAAMEELRATVATELVAELGVTVTFSDADGDSAG
ncbi:MAG: hypothetical protein KDB24_00105 [Microthrixaceae bacterium]|nr:hypothetical protein [Microthrixaceae bacterium]